MAVDASVVCVADVLLPLDNPTTATGSRGPIAIVLAFVKTSVREREQVLWPIPELVGTYAPYSPRRGTTYPSTISLPRTASNVGSIMGRAGLVECRGSTSLFFATGRVSPVTRIGICVCCSAATGDAPTACSGSICADIFRRTNPGARILCLPERLLRTSAIVPLPFPRTNTPL